MVEDMVAVDTIDDGATRDHDQELRGDIDRKHCLFFYKNFV